MTKKLRTEPRIEDPDDFYAGLISLHEGLDSEQSQSLNSKLILLMANHIGDRQTLDELLALAHSYRPQE